MPRRGRCSQGPEPHTLPGTCCPLTSVRMAPREWQVTCGLDCRTPGFWDPLGATSTSNPVAQGPQFLCPFLFRGRLNDNEP